MDAKQASDWVTGRKVAATMGSAESQPDDESKQRLCFEADKGAGSETPTGADQQAHGIVAVTTSTSAGASKAQTTNKPPTRAVATVAANTAANTATNIDKRTETHKKSPPPKTQPTAVQIAMPSKGPEQQPSKPSEKPSSQRMASHHERKNSGGGGGAAATTDANAVVTPGGGSSTSTSKSHPGSTTSQTGTPTTSKSQMMRYDSMQTGLSRIPVLENLDREYLPPGCAAFMVTEKIKRVFGSQRFASTSSSSRQTTERSTMQEQQQQESTPPIASQPASSSSPTSLPSPRSAETVSAAITAAGGLSPGHSASGAVSHAGQSSSAREPSPATSQTSATLDGKSHANIESPMRNAAQAMDTTADGATKPIDVDAAGASQGQYASQTAQRHSNARTSGEGNGGELKSTSLYKLPQDQSYQPLKIMPTQHFPLPPVLLQSRNPDAIPEALQHLPPDARIDVADRRSGKLLDRSKVGTIRDIATLLQRNAAAEPLVSTSSSSTSAIGPSGERNSAKPIVVREARSAPATTVCGEVRRQIRNRRILRNGDTVIVMQGPRAGMVGTLVKHLPGGCSSVRKCFTPFPQPDRLVLSEFLERYDVNDEKRMMELRKRAGKARASRKRKLRKTKGSSLPRNRREQSTKDFVQQELAVVFLNEVNTFFGDEEERARAMKQSSDDAGTAGGAQSPTTDTATATPNVATTANAAAAVADIATPNTTAAASKGAHDSQSVAQQQHDAHPSENTNAGGNEEEQEFFKRDHRAAWVYARSFFEPRSEKNQSATRGA